jgi:type I restriction enzyme M protein
MITGTLKSKVDKIWEAFWSGGIANPLTVIEQFTYLLFLRRLDETQQLEEKKANLIGKPLENPIYKEGEQELRWSHFSNLDPQSMFDLFTKTTQDRPLTVFDHMKQAGSKAGVFAQHMKGATFMIPTPKLLDTVVQMIKDIQMADRDTKGDLYEYLLSKIASAGQNGQFRTPRHIIRMMVNMVEPNQEDTVCDPSAGTSGFLVAAGEYVHDAHKEWFNDKDFRDHYNNRMFTGMEFDSTMLRIGAMNLQLHGIENPQLIGIDSLSEANASVKDAFSLVLANPPFKGSLDYDGVDDSILKVVKTKKTELLFLGLILRMLKTGGRAAVIVPDGVLFGSSNAHKQIRQEIIENHKLDAVVKMPSGVFKPYAGVSTAILFFTKTGTGGTDNVWFYDMKADGFSLDDKRAPLVEEELFEQCFISPETAVENEALTQKCDLADILVRWKAHNKALQVAADSPEAERKRTEASFLVPLQEIINNEFDLSISRYKEIEYEVLEYEKPQNIIQEIEELDNDRIEILSSLKKLLS